MPTHPTAQDLNAQIIQALSARMSIEQWQSSVDVRIGPSHFPGNMRSCNNAAAHHINSVHADYKRLDSEAAALLAQSVGVSELTLGNGLYHLAHVMRALDHQYRDFLAALEPNEEAQKLTPLQAMVATHYQGGEFSHIETQDDAQDVGDGLFTFCINEAGDASDKSELIGMLNRAIDQMRSLVGELEAEQ